MSVPVAILDACVLYPAGLRDVLMSFAASKEATYRARWTRTILDEMKRNVLLDLPHIAPAQIGRTIMLMNKAVPGSLVEGYESLIESLWLPDLNDRHVLAAAIVGNADTVVTFNLKDFPISVLERSGISASEPDQFLLHLIDSSPSRAIDALSKMRMRLSNPSMTPDEFLISLRNQRLPRTVERFAQFRSSL